MKLQEEIQKILELREKEERIKLLGNTYSL